METDQYPPFFRNVPDRETRTMSVPPCRAVYRGEHYGGTHFAYVPQCILQYTLLRRDLHRKVYVL
jgi:hypothetical protein